MGALAQAMVNVSPMVSKKLIISSLILVFGLVGFAAPQMNGDPYSEAAYKEIRKSLGLGDRPLSFQAVTEVCDCEKPDFSEKTITLGSQGLPDIILKMKIPNQRSKPLPVVMFFTGFQTGADVLDLLGTPKDVIYVGYQYSSPLNFEAMNWDWKRVEINPVLMAISMKWLFQQSFVDTQKVNVVSVSFGTLFYPLAQRFLNEEGIFPRTATFGYGGGNIPEIIGHHAKGKIGSNEMMFLKLLVQSQTWFVDPQYHIQHLRGPFLVVRGAEDTVFPMVSQQVLVQGLPEPKKIVVLPGGHIQPDRTEIVHDFMGVLDDFLRQNSAL